MREQQLSKVLVKYLPLFVHQLHSYIPQGKTLHLQAVVTCSFQRYQTALR